MHRELTTGVLFVVLAAGVLHASWNAVTKSVEDRFALLSWIGVTLVVGGAVGLLVTGLPPAPAIAFVLASVAVHAFYNVGLMNSYRLGSFNQMYPAARGTAPLLVALGAFLVAHEQPSTLALVGILVLAAGLMTLALSAGRLARSELPALTAALLTGVTIAGYTLLDGLGARRAGSPYSYSALLFLLEGATFPLVALFRRPRLLLHGGSIAVKGSLAGVLVLLAYGAVIWAQVRAPLAEVSALRETGVISAAVMGAVVFKESFGARRIVASLFVALGIVLIAL